MDSLAGKISRKGTFTAGDIRQHSKRQLGSAVGDGITPAFSVDSYLTEGRDQGDLQDRMTHGGT